MSAVEPSNMAKQKLKVSWLPKKDARYSEEEKNCCISESVPYTDARSLHTCSIYLSHYAVGHNYFID